MVLRMRGTAHATPVALIWISPPNKHIYGKHAAPRYSLVDLKLHVWLYDVGDSRPVKVI